MPKILAQENLKYIYKSLFYQVEQFCLFHACLPFHLWLNSREDIFGTGTYTWKPIKLSPLKSAWKQCPTILLSKNYSIYLVFTFKNSSKSLSILCGSRFFGLFRKRKNSLIAELNDWAQLFETNDIVWKRLSLKFQTLISNICQYFLLKKCEKLFQCKSFSHFFNKKYQCIWL